MKTPSTLQANRGESVDDLFRRFAVRYGRHWLDMWPKVIPMAEIKNEWAYELARFHRVQIEQAILHAGKFPPTLPEFSALCSQMPKPGISIVPATGPTLIEDKTKNEMPASVRAKLDAFLGRKPRTEKTPAELEAERARQTQALRELGQ